MKHDFPPHLVTMTMELIQIEDEICALENDLRYSLAETLIASRFAGHIEHGLTLERGWNNIPKVAESAAVDTLQNRPDLLENMKPQAARGLLYMMQNLPRYR